MRKKVLSRFEYHGKRTKMLEINVIYSNCRLLSNSRPTKKF